MTDPARCPWCASTTGVTSFHLSSSRIERDGQRHYVECKADACGATGPMRRTREDAVASWNFVAREAVR